MKVFTLITFFPKYEGTKIKKFHMLLIACFAIAVRSIWYTTNPLHTGNKGQSLQRLSHRSAVSPFANRLTTNYCVQCVFSEFHATYY